MRSTLNIKGKLIDLSTPIVMGILNITDDSFFDGGRYVTPDSALERAREMIKEGATLVDVGGASSRPGAPEISADEEIKRVIPVIDRLKHEMPEIIISVDTYHSVVAERAVESGADIINDISAGDMDGRMLETVSVLKVPYIAMHMKGTPLNMQLDPHYDDVAGEIMEYFLQKKEIWEKSGIKDVIIDPGFGFGKTLADNYKLLSALSYLSELEYPILVGVSRKSMINKVLGTNPANALNGTTAVHAIALMRGASILRAHDVREAVQTCKIFQAFRDNDIYQ